MGVQTWLHTRHSPEVQFSKCGAQVVLTPSRIIPSTEMHGNTSTVPASELEYPVEAPAGSEEEYEQFFIPFKMKNNEESLRRPFKSGRHGCWLAGKNQTESRRGRKDE